MAMVKSAQVLCRLWFHVSGDTRQVTSPKGHSGEQYLHLHSRMGSSLNIRVPF